MTSANTQQELKKYRIRIAERVRALRQARRWTQAELAERLWLSQSRLSEIESGDGSFTAEQLLLILTVFNVPASHFAEDSQDRGLEVQNALARLGAAHLQEGTDTFPGKGLDDAAAVIREALADGTPRLVTALAAVLVRNIDRVNLSRLHLGLCEAGFERRLPWLTENTLDAIAHELSATPPRDWAQRCRRATVILGTFLDGHVLFRAPPPTVPDVLDPDIRSKKSLNEISSSSSAISRKWAIVTRLQPEDFGKALGAARAGN